MSISTISEAQGQKLPGESHSFFGAAEPPPLNYLLEGVLPQGHLSLIFAPGGMKKSLLALYISICVALGLPALGLPSVRGRVLFVDYELDFNLHVRRAIRILRALGLTTDAAGLEGYLDYYKPEAPLSTDRGRRELRAAVEHFRPSLAVVDSLSIGSAGADLVAPQDMMPILKWLVDLPTSVLALDHTPKLVWSRSAASPYGTVFKTNLARSVFVLSEGKGGLSTLTATKANFRELPDSLSFKVAFGDDQISFDAVKSARGVALPMSGPTVTLRAVRELHRATGAPVTQADVERWRREDADAPEAELGTIRNHFTKLKRDGLLAPSGTDKDGYLPTV